MTNPPAANGPAADDAADRAPAAEARATAPEERATDAPPPGAAGRDVPRDEADHQVTGEAEQPTSGTPYATASGPPTDTGFPTSAPPDGFATQSTTAPPFTVGAPFDVPPAPGAQPPPFDAASAGPGLRRQHLVRPTKGRYLAGVCAAIARATNTDPILWRVLLAVLTLFGGVGLLGYLLGWLLIPAEGDTASPLEAMLGRGKSNTSVPIAVVIAAFAVLTFAFVISDNVGPAVIGLVVVLGTVALLLRNQGDRQQQDPTAAPPFGPPPMAPPVGTTMPPFAAPPPPTSSPQTRLFPASGPFPPFPMTPATPTMHPADAPTVNLSGVPSAPQAPAPSSAPPVPPITPTTPMPPLPPTLAVPAYGPPFAPHGPYASSSPYAASLGYTPGPTSGMPAYPGLVPATPKPPKPPKVRSRLGRITLSLTMLALGVIAVFDVTGHVRASTYFAVALAVIGLGLLVGAWFGRARVLVLLGVVLSIGLAIATASPQYAPDESRVERAINAQPTSVDEIFATYDTDVGDIRLDLSRVDFTNRQVDAGVFVNIRGDVHITLPPNVNVVIEADIGAGDCRILTHECGGLHQHQQVSDDGADGPGGGRIHLTIDVRLGSVEVTR